MKRFLRVLAVLVLVATLLGAGLAWKVHHDVTVLKVATLPVASDKVTRPVRLLQISDFHNGHGPATDDVIAAVTDTHPDAVLLTGDLVNTIDPDWQPLEHLLDALDQGTVPTYVIWGNHDHWSNRLDELRALLARHPNITLLVNQSTTFIVAGQTLNLVGTDDYGERFGDLGQAMSGVDTSLFTLVMSHGPEVREALPRAGVDLVITGHTHGGQVRVPGVGCVVAPNQGWWPDYCAGMYDIGGTPLYIDSGVGWSGRAVRLFVQSQVTMIEVSPR